MQFKEPADPLEQQLAEENRRLARDLAEALRERDQLKQDLEQALAIARNSKQELQDFVYAASHDLKEPLRSISSYTQLLQRHASDPEQMAEYSRFVVEGVAHANKLLEQLLRLSRAGAHPKRRSVGLSVPLQTALFQIQALAKELNAVVKADALPEFSVDEAQFAQVFEHLLENALKYHGAEPPHVQISGEETDDGIVVAIRDNGTGIPEEFREHVFKPFKRLHGREIPGSGLGLAISRRIVEAHEGKIWAEGTEGGGSTLKIHLPY